MEIIYPILAFIAGGIIIFLWQQKRLSDERREIAAQLNETEKLGLAKLAEAEKSKSLAEQQISTLSKDFAEVKTELAAERQKNEASIRLLTTSMAELDHAKKQLNDKAVELEQIQKRLTIEFENVAHKILKEHSAEFTTLNQKNIGDILSPLKEKISTFEKKVEESYEKSLRDQTDLKAELKKLQELNAKIGNDAQNLTNALKGDVKKQGNWGEVVLERVLERSGLTLGREYEREVVDENSDGKQIRPDVIIHLPDKKHLIVDAKVSLIAYERLVNEASDELRVQHLADHLKSLRSHIKMLSDKHYPTAKNLNSPDFVLLFLPIESSFSIAIQEDQELFNYAWDNKVVIVSPSTLLASLRTIASIWKQENQTKNALEIASLGASLYDKFVNFIQDLEKVGKGIDTAQANYANALNKLHTGKGNLVRTSERLKDLGIKTQKSLPDYLIEDDNPVPSTEPSSDMLEE
ncbi:MAG: DNA recombination protein RmuC [Prolixibacteraceae bacterium]|jgi:DNA recombination protein RmuC|nr:DNA recombination protein RmuC [Prolixibacteraceae bacterium]